jgi:DNA-binding SARP family transcriptional activator
VPPSTNRPQAPRLELLGGFTLLLGGEDVLLPPHAQRVLARLALGRQVRSGHPRALLAHALWPHVPGGRRQANLRTALWRIRRLDPHLVVTTQQLVRLGSAVEVDVHASLAQAARLLGDDVLLAQDTRLQPLTLELLPAWDDDWLVLEREHVRQVHLHALEMLSCRLRAAGQFGRAVEAALAAVADEPLRESAEAALIAAHLSEGNAVEAHRQYLVYRRLLWDELRLTPAHSFEDYLRAHAPGLRGAPQFAQLPAAGAGSGRPLRRRPAPVTLSAPADTWT